MRVYLLSLGCPKNTVDSEIMAGTLLRSGDTLVPSPEEADAAIVNTCGFIAPAKEESLDAVMELVRLKGQRPGLRVVMAGCLAQRYPRELSAEMPEVDAFVGVNDFPRIAGILRQLDGRPVETAGPRYLPTSRTPRFRVTPPHLAYVKISEGCSHGCAFCAIPAIRGPLRSRPEDDILEEVEGLLAEGVRELVVIGQDTTAYGRDRGRPGALVPLLRRLAGFGGEYRVRLMYAFPAAIGDDLLDAMAANPRVCRYLDIPFQHAHPATLRRMGRGGDGERFLALLGRIREALPGVALRSSLIAGYPGETEAEYRALRDFVRAADFEHLGVFGYSDEEGTPAFDLPKKVPAEKGAARAGSLMRLQRRLVRRRNRERVGRTVRVLVDGVRDDADFLVQARTEGQAFDIDSVVYLTTGPVETLVPGRFVDARLTRAVEYDVEAEVVPPGGETGQADPNHG
ncbi:MAG: 30S ribosomal protein S12 methylthiotransferase RimO [Acidobacteria bacterium]|nr:30S ribosomal protein S12 methylthiotransferase RimO [Acidobacteriota bacterium]